MCGIAGFLLNASRHPGREPPEVLLAMTDAIQHRGPDGSGVYTTDTSGGGLVGFGHRRLSIIDIEGGSQPMHWPAAGLWISFNGEIYNFRELRSELAASGARFATRSDTEVILAAYERHGPRCVEKLRGMFAFSLWDEPNQRLLLARDRFGKKPLYYAETSDGLLFGSEVKSLLAFPGMSPEVDHEAVWDYFALRYVPGPATLFKGIRKLPAGAVLVHERGKMTIARYYTPPDALPHQELDVTSDEEVVRHFALKLEDAVKVRLVSDVPFGAFLSGGIDSSVVVALMARHMGEPVKTFSVAFAEEAFSEGRYSTLIARHYGTDHHELIVRADDVMRLLPAMIQLRDAPVSEPSDIPIFQLATEARRHVKMVLTGEGADEVLGGYRKHVFERVAGTYASLPRFLRTNILAPLIDTLPYRFHSIKTAISALGIEQWQERMARWFGAISDAERSQLLSLERPGIRNRAIVSPVPADANSPLQRVLAFDQLSWLPDNLLERGDRMTMGASIEARMPFIDHELAAEAARLPDHLRIRGLQTKVILRKIATNLVPEQIITRPKVGFRVPVHLWFRSHLQTYLTDTLLSANSKSAAYYRPGELRRVLREHFDGRRNHEKLIWAMLNLELWHQRYA